MQNSVDCYETDGTTIKTRIQMPDVLTIPIRKDLVELAFKCVRMNKRQAYAVSPVAGMQHSAHGWGTGRAVARVPRVAGSGTGRAGQGAFANFCRKGRLAHPTNTLRRWARKFNLTAKRHAIAMALAATAIAPIVESRGHKIGELKSIPLVVSNEVSNIKTTKEAVAVLNNLGLKEELNRVIDSKHIRAGKGKMRNRRYVKKKGVLIIYKEESAMNKAFRNIEGVDLMSVERMSLLELCPGGHLGRLVLWVEDAFLHLNSLYGKIGEKSSLKKDYVLPAGIVSTDNVEDVFYSDEVQALLDCEIQSCLERSVRSPKKIVEINPYL